MTLPLAIWLPGATSAVMLVHFRSFAFSRLTGRGVTLMSLLSIVGVGAGQFASGAAPKAAYEAVFVFYAVTLARAPAVYGWSRDSRPRSYC